MRLFYIFDIVTLFFILFLKNALFFVHVSTGMYRHYEDIENMVQVLELGLWGGKASMVLLLPFHVERLARLEHMLTLEQLEKWLGKLSSMSMALSLPRVNVSSTLSLQVLHHLIADIKFLAHTTKEC